VGTANDRIGGVRLGIAHHYGWALAVTATVDYRVVGRRRIELIEPGVPTAPIHHEGGAHLLHQSGEPLDDNSLAALVADVRASVIRATSTALDELGIAIPEPIDTISLRAWPAEFPEDIALQGVCHARAEPTRSCTANSHVNAAGWSIPTTPTTSRTMQSASWVSERTRCFVARGQGWGHRGRRTIG
jgi:hypothetical protein